MTVRIPIPLLVIVLAAAVLVWNPALPIGVPTILGPSEWDAVIVRESEADTPELGALVVSLRNGANADALKAANHKLTVLDDDDDRAAAYQPVSGVELLLVAKDGALLKRQPCPLVVADALAVIQKGP